MLSGLENQVLKVVAIKRAKEFSQNIYKPKSRNCFIAVRKAWITLSIKNHKYI